MMPDENGRKVGKEYGVAGDKQLQEKKAERAKYYWPPGATEPILIEEKDAADNQGTSEAGE